jgi:hypothetical protein
MKKYILAIMAITFSIQLLSQTNPISYDGLPTCYKTDNLDLSTGFNYIWSGTYSAGQNSSWWALRNAPVGVTTPQCGNINFQTGSASSMIIRPVTNGGLPPINASMIGCNPNNNEPYRYERTFYADITTSVSANLNLSLSVDDQIQAIIFNGTNLGFSTNCMQNFTNAPSILSATVTVNSGQNVIQILVRNREFPNELPLTLTSPTGLSVAGSISTIGVNSFVRNQFYIPQVNLDLGCGYTQPEIVQQAVFSQYCDNDGDGIAHVLISKFESKFHIFITTK